MQKRKKNELEIKCIKSILNFFFFPECKTNNNTAKKPTKEEYYEKSKEKIEKDAQNS